MKKLPIVECLRHIDHILHNMNECPTAGNPFAVFTDGHEIILDGLFTGKSLWHEAPQGFRWHCPKNGSKGLFGKGIACYSNNLPSWSIELPSVK